MKKLLFVFNPMAGKGLIKTHLCSIIDIFTKGGYDVTSYPTQAPMDGYEKILSDGKNYDLICVSGGDGSLSEAVSALVKFDEDEKVPLGYIPAGSTNDCAYSLGIPTKMTEAAQAIIDGVYFKYDIGDFNGKNFVYVAAFGAFTEVTYETSQKMKNIFGHAAYLGEALKRINKIQGYNLVVEHDGETIEGNFMLGIISNTISIGGMKKFICDDVCYDDGLYEVVLMRTPKNLIEFQKLLNDSVFNKLDTENFVTFKTSEVTITSLDEPLKWTLDGESGGVHQKSTIKNLKQAVTLKIKPSNFTAEQLAVNTLTKLENIGDLESCFNIDGHPVVFEDQKHIED